MADCPKCPPVGAPLWLATFADLMSLLMCFFVLLLSFATMDAAKFKKMAISLENAFGVQRDIPAMETPMGTSIIAQHFSPAQTDPTPLEQIKQTTTTQSDSLNVDAKNMEQVKQQLMEIMLQDIEDQSEKIKQALKDEIEQGLVAVETDGLKIIVRIQEKGSFSSGSAVLKSGFEPVMNKITESIKNAKGKIIIAGHTDDIPINTDWYRSNWELSASRAVTVAHQILKHKGIDQNRMIIEGYADTKPLVPNSSAANRAKNRRVEVVLAQEDPEVNAQNITIDNVSDLLPDAGKQ